MVKWVASVLACLSAAALGLTRAYIVEPVQQSWSGWTEGEDGYVSEVLTCCWDELEYCELFAGSHNDTGAFFVDVYEVGGGDDPIAYNLTGVPPTRSHAWLKLTLTTESGYKFTKGKRYEFRFTRSGSKSDLVGLDCGPADATMA